MAVHKGIFPSGRPASKQGWSREGANGLIDCQAGHPKGRVSRKEGHLEGV